MRLPFQLRRCQGPVGRQPEAAARNERASERSTRSITRVYAPTHTAARTFTFNTGVPVAPQPIHNHRATTTVATTTAITATLPSHLSPTNALRVFCLPRTIPFLFLPFTVHYTFSFSSSSSSSASSSFSSSFVVRHEAIPRITSALLSSLTVIVVALARARAHVRNTRRCTQKLHVQKCILPT